MKKRTKLLYALLISSVLLSGCGSTSTDSHSDPQNSSAAENTAATESTDTTETAASSFTGRIESVDTSASTITLSTMPQGNPPAAPSDSNGNPPADDSSDNSNSSSDASPDTNGNPPVAPSDSNGNPPAAPSDNSNSSSDASSDTNGNPPAAPSDSNGNPPADKPSDNSNSSSDASSDTNGNPPADKPSDNNGNPPADKPSDSNGNPPAAPSDNSNSSSDASTDTNGAAPADDSSANSDASPADKPSDNNDASQNNGGAPETTTITVTDATDITDESGSKITLASLSVGTMVTVELDADGNALSIRIASAENMAAPGMSGAAQGAPDSYTAATEYTEDTTVSDASFSSTETDENAVLLQTQAYVSLDNVTIDRTSSDSTGGDQASFYGVGSAVLTTDGTLNLNNSTISTDAAGGAGVFAYGNGTATVSDSTITTNADTSGGIHVAGGGTLHASNLSVETNGASSAAIRSDRGGGTMDVTGGTYTSNGSGSPAVYCTADITISDALLNATGSEAVCIEGLNSLALTNCELSGNMPEQEQNDCTWTVILYQSMSGDSQIGNSSFRMTGGKLTSYNGGLFYTTNTESTFYLSDVTITPSDTNDFFLKCTGNKNQRGWGESGANGADCTFTADKQTMVGDILWDSISTLDFTMSNGSILTGSFLQDESSVTTTGSGYANLTIDESSSWIVTGDSVLSSLTAKGTIQDEDGNSVTIKDNNGTVLSEGTSPYTITVTSYE